MIVLNLCCDHDHPFEGWFGSAEAFELQRKQGLVACPMCGSTSVVRKPSAPYVNTRSTVAQPPAPRPASPPAHAAPMPLPPPEAMAAMMRNLRNMASTSEDVGKRFPEEARKIHYGEAEARSIKGQATADDVGELLDEGIMVVPLPPDEGELH